MCVCGGGGGPTCFFVSATNTIVKQIRIETQEIHRNILCRDCTTKALNNICLFLTSKYNRIFYKYQ